MAQLSTPASPVALTICSLGVKEAMATSYIKDPYVYLAAQLFGVKDEEVTFDMREAMRRAVSYAAESGAPAKVRFSLLRQHLNGLGNHLDGIKLPFTLTCDQGNIEALLDYFATPKTGPSEVSPGLYEHFKGTRYRVLLVSRDSESREKRAIYTPLTPEEGWDGVPWDRPVGMWGDLVRWPDGKYRTRFARVSD
jgi:hypothetical protein